MYDIIIFGTGRTSKIIESGLNESVNIICYLDNNSSKWNELHNGKKIFNPKKIDELIYDYIVIASQFNESICSQLLELNVNPQKILQFYKYFATCYNHVEYTLQCLYRKSKDVEVIATGISYMVSAINGESLCKKFFNIANSSQDLYYDYNLIKYIIKNHRSEFENLKYIFIGLSYYSFEYDMSLSSMKGNVAVYYEVILKKHHFKDIDSLLCERNNQKNIGSKIFKMDTLNRPILDWKCEGEEGIVKINEEMGKNQALLDGNKDYPKTKKENKKIFLDYLRLLKQNDVKPIVVVSPVTKYYARFFPKRLKDEFYEIINEAKNKYDFQFVDYFNSELFEEEDFYDVSHLNDRGGKKFTSILNNIVKW